MKTTKTLIAALLVLVTASTFAQAKKGLFVSVKYSHEMNRIETWVSHISDRISHNNSDEAELPVISETYYADFADITYENESLIEDALSMETWMSAPFEEAFYEDALSMEAWMSAPFEETLYEDALSLEAWMSETFETDEPQNELGLEEWMSTPFELDEIIQVEDWMTASNW